ncbi:hypothetical protein [Mucilaginibacter gilvus]|uniref:Uncharacterized protein n=1 Tax=Mucilaginibacter gilvus TaxID=2305909 RepID=A0A3S3UQH0_9SPHI|nr:hypothetical protein [Mucilaginibacter gilvus]RWY48333.1 hypothetical protein EPL05_19515 [Mucilaginibacter gilvus]
MEEIKPITNKVPFKVSARTARLIGRENIATSKGAIIELVKNGYDADSKVSIVFFDNKHSSFQAEISEDHFTELELMEVPTELLLRVYQKTDEGYKVRNDIGDGVKAEFRKHISKLNIPASLTPKNG